MECADPRSKGVDAGVGAPHQCSRVLKKTKWLGEGGRHWPNPRLQQLLPHAILHLLRARQGIGHLQRREQARQYQKPAPPCTEKLALREEGGHRAKQVHQNVWTLMLFLQRGARPLSCVQARHMHVRTLGSTRWCGVLILRCTDQSCLCEASTWF